MLVLSHFTNIISIFTLTTLKSLYLRIMQNTLYFHKYQNKYKNTLAFVLTI